MRWKLVALVALGAAVRFVALGHLKLRPRRGGDGRSGHSPQPLGHAAHRLEGRAQPTLYYVLAWAWSKPFGLSEDGLRSLSALVGTATVLAAYWAAREFAGHRAGLAAAALFALNPYLVWYSQEARAYALLALTATLSLGFFARAREHPSARNLACWAIACGAALVSHYFAVFLVAPQALWLLLGSGERRRVTVAVLGIVAVGAALLPLMVSQEGSDRRNGFTETPLASRAGESLVGFAAGEEPAPLAGSPKVDVIQLAAAGVGFALLAVSLCSLAGADSKRRRRVGPLLAAFGFAFLLPILLGYAGLDFVNPRNLIGALVPLLLVIACGLTSVHKRQSTPAALGLASFVSAGVLLATSVSGEMERPNFRAAAASIAASRNTAVVAIQNADDPLAYYLGARKLDRSNYPNGVRVRHLRAISTNFRVQPPSGFHQVDLSTAGGVFLIWHFAAQHPTRLDPAALRGVLHERAEPLVIGNG